FRASGGAKAVGDFLEAQKSGGWRSIAFGQAEMGSFRLREYKLVEMPISVEVVVEGVKDPSVSKSRYESVQGVLRVPSLARYARYVEGNSTLIYTGGTLVDGEILVSGDISLAGSTVHFTRLVSTGGTLINRPAGRYDFGFREKEVDIPTLNHVHVNSLDHTPYNSSKFPSTFQAMAQNGGIALFGSDHSPKNPSWGPRLNSGGGCHPSGPCATLLAGCYDTLSATRRSPVVVAGSAIAIDLSQVPLSGDSVIVMVSPVVYDAGGDGSNWFTLGTPARRYALSLSSFKQNAVLYLP